MKAPTLDDRKLDELVDLVVERIAEATSGPIARVVKSYLEAAEARLGDLAARTKELESRDDEELEMIRLRLDALELHVVGAERVERRVDDIVRGLKALVAWHPCDGDGCPYCELGEELAKDGRL